MAVWLSLVPTRGTSEAHARTMWISRRGLLCLLVWMGTWSIAWGQIKARCRTVGPCEKCNMKQRLQSSCVPTGYRQAITCKPDLSDLEGDEINQLTVEQRSTRHAWQSCRPEGVAGVAAMLAFQGACGLGAATTGYVVYRKRNARGT
mmetsp:Transcript_8197/g.50952  ORF Transcript_8197/g.50952 Transcript_8197/m.50952 type:complete len:147 (-) Transcript_8197:1268-1708(-)